MKTRNLLTTVATLAVLGFASANAAANEQDGVACPGGYESSFANGVFKCSKTTTVYADTICPPGFPNYHKRGNRDVCTNVNSITIPYYGEIVLDTAKMAYPVPLAIGGSWTLQVNGGTGDRDRFARTQTDYQFPGLPALPIGPLAQNGVRCPGGYTGSHNAGANRLTCYDDVARKSACLGFYSLDVNSGADRCLFLADKKPTLPEGEGSSSGWTLHVDGSTGVRDKWTKRRYAYPSPA